VIAYTEQLFQARSVWPSVVTTTFFLYRDVMMATQQMKMGVVAVALLRLTGPVWGLMLRAQPVR